MKKTYLMLISLIIGVVALTYVTFQSLSGIDDDIFATNFSDDPDLDND